LSVKAVLKRFQPPLNDEAVDKISAEIEREVIAPLMAKIHLQTFKSKVEKVNGATVKTRKKA